jgi:hypothetical protein
MVLGCLPIRNELLRTRINAVHRSHVADPDAEGRFLKALPIRLWKSEEKLAFNVHLNLLTLHQILDEILVIY